MPIIQNYINKFFNNKFYNTKYTGIQADTSNSAEGRVIPLVYGTKMIPCPVIQFGGQNSGVVLEVLPITKAIIPFWSVLCYGKIEVVYIRENIGEEYKTYDNPHQDPVYGAELLSKFNDGTGSYYPTGLKDNSGVALPYINKLPGIAHQFFSVDALRKMGTTTLAGQSVDRFEARVHRILSGSVIAASDYPDGESNPVAVIYDLLTNKQYGCGMATYNIELTTFNETAQYLYALGIGINLAIFESVSAREVIDNICDDCGIQLWKDRLGKYKIKAYDPAHVTSYDAVMGDTDCIEFARTRKQFTEMDTEIKFTYYKIDPVTKEEIETVTTESNDAVYMMNGKQKIAGEYDMSMLSRGAVGKRVRKIMYEQSHPINTIKCTTNMKYASLEPMDVVIVTNTESDINAMPFRVKNIDYGDVGENKLKFTLEQAIEFSGSVDITIPVGDREVPGYSESALVENLTFPAFATTSNATAAPFTTPANVIVKWGVDQVNTGLLALNTDYTIVGNNSIKLTEPKWTSTIESNSLGLLNVDVYEAI